MTLVYLYSNKNGQATFDPGMNLYPGVVTQRNGQWTIPGGYTIGFDSDCNITCQGECTCDACEQTAAEDFIDTSGTKSLLCGYVGLAIVSILVVFFS